MDTDQIAIFIEQHATKEMIDPEVEGFLEHFGVRGQRWGVQNRSSSSGSSNVSGGGVKRTALMIGGATAAVLIAKHFNVPMKSIKMAAVGVGGATAGGMLANAILKRQGKTKMTDVQKARQVLFGNKK